MTSGQALETAFTWEELQRLVPKEIDRVNGQNNSYSRLRLFGQSEKAVRVTLYRDNHAWCPYCQKVWLWLEWKQIPYKIKKVTMRCYGNKETWYRRLVPSGMLPALEIDDQLITESDFILLALENIFGPLGLPLEDHRAIELRQLERQLFGAWCRWLCSPALTRGQEIKRKEQFQALAKKMEAEFLQTKGAWLDPSHNSADFLIPGSSDVVFIPYLERMNASLAYYKGFNLRKEHPLINVWFQSLEKLAVYRGTQSDFHTHAHDLPPQMGGCWVDNNPSQEQFSKAIDIGEGLGEMETSFSATHKEINNTDEEIALGRVFKHRHRIKEINPIGEKLFDQPLRAVLTRLVTGKPCSPDKGSASGLRYLRDRISVPRDMPLLSARKLRKAIEETASLDGPTQGLPLPVRHRMDQNPKPFVN